MAQHFFVRAGVTALRRLRKTDNNRAARACGARVVHRIEEITEDCIGKEAGLYEVRKIGDEYHSFIVDCADPKACTIMLRGGSKDVLNEVERNLHDAMNVARNCYKDPMIAPGGGAIEMEVSSQLMKKSNSVEPKLRNIYRAVAQSMEVIPRILVCPPFAPSGCIHAVLTSGMIAGGQLRRASGAAGDRAAGQACERRYG